MPDLRIPIVHPMRDALRALADAAARGIAYDAGTVLYGAATDPTLDRESVETALVEAERLIDYRIRECDPELPQTRDRACNLRDYVRHVVGPGAYGLDAIVAGVAHL